MAVVEALAQIIWLDGADTEGVGWTVIVKVLLIPEQPFAEGVTVIVPLMAFAVAFVAVKEKLPEPLAAKPIAVLLFVHV